MTYGPAATSRVRALHGPWRTLVGVLQDMAPQPVEAYAHGRDNNFNLVRFIAATSVILFHSYALLGQRDPLYVAARGAVDMGYLGVMIFFVVSGFLVTKSFERQRSVRAFVAARVLRIYPGLAIAALFTVAVGALCTTVPWYAYFRDSQTLEYLAVTISGWDLRDRLPGVFVNNPYPGAVNGSLWTLPIELKFYVGCLAAGVAGLLRGPWRFNLAFAAALAIFGSHPDWFPVHPEMAVVRQFALAFSLGAFAWVNRRWLPASPALAAACLAVLFVNPLQLGRGIYFLPLVAYVLLVFALHPALRLSTFNKLGDYSYGLYIYSFPIQQFVIARWAQVSSSSVFWAAFPATLVFAVASWHLLERRILALKGPHAAAAGFAGVPTRHPISQNAANEAGYAPSRQERAES